MVQVRSSWREIQQILSIPENNSEMLRSHSVRKHILLGVINQLELKLIGVVRTDDYAHKLSRTSAMKQRPPVEFISAVAVFVDRFGDFVSIPQEFVQSRVPAPRRIQAHGVQHGRLTYAVFSGEQGHSAQPGHNEIVDTTKPAYR